MPRRTSLLCPLRLSPGREVADSHDECRDALLQLRARRPAGDLLLAQAGPGARQSGLLADCFYHHTATQLELAVVTRGQVRMATPAEVYRVTPGKLLVIERGVYHAELLTSQAYDICWFHLERTRAHVSVHRHTSQGLAESPEWELPGRTDVEQLGAAIAGELAAGDWDYPSAVAALLEYLTCILIRRAQRGAVIRCPPREAPTLCLDPRRAALIQAALDFCDAHFREGVTQADVARDLGCTSRYLGRLISSHLGHSLSHHLRNLRMAEARHLLHHSGLPVRTIAATVGYPYPAHFTRAFTRAVGVSPETFRHRLRAL